MSRFNVIRKLVFGLVLSVLFLSSAGYGVIQISSIEDLQKIGRDPAYPLDGEYELTRDIDASATVNWNNGAGFEPIGGDWYTPFTGKFDGKGYKITGLYINRSSEDYVGLFGCIGSGGEVKNVGLEDVMVSGYGSVGGLVGSNYGTVSGCYATGSVSGDSNVGGLVGSNWGGRVNDCYAMGPVTGYTYRIGGLIGSMWGGSVTNTYSTGLVGDSGSSKGGLIGYRDGEYSGTVTSSYWDVETSGMSTSAGGEGKTTAEMKQRATYVGWDFVNVWGIDDGVSYPYLMWQGGPVILEGEGSGMQEGEGSVDGVWEGEGSGSVPEGEGSGGGGVQEGDGSGGGDVPEGEGSGGVQEGDGSGDGTQEGEDSGGDRQVEITCGGCGSKKSNADIIKFLLDFIAVGTVISLMSGVSRRRR